MRACTALLMLLASAAALSAQGLVASAEHATATGDYTLAARTYEQVLTQQGYSAPVLFNLGNVWLRLGKPGRAILAYERALVLAPQSPAIEANLAAAQQRAGITPPAVGPWLATARHFSFDTYTWAALVGIWVLCSALVLLCARGPVRRFARPLILVAALTLCVSADAAVLCWQDLYRAVILSPAPLRLAPAQSAAASGSLREGEVVWVQDHYGDFRLVRTAEGHTGWVGNDAAVPVRVLRQ